MKSLHATLVISILCCVNGCSNGSSTAVPELTLLSNLELSGGLTDVWGYFDEATGKEYALVGFGLFNPDANGVYIVDVSDAQNPTVVATVDSVPGFDIKTYKNFMYTVNGGSSGQGGIVDLSDPANPQVVGSFPSSHNIFISENGYLFSECPGLRVFDLNSDPTNPTLEWSDGDQACHDAAVIGNRLFDFHGGAGTNIYDISMPTRPALLGTIRSPLVSFHHSGWTSADGHFLYICDEGSRHPASDITVWDIRNISNPDFVANYKDSTAIVHNLYVVGDYAYVAYYTAGFRVFDISDPREIKLVREFDTSPSTGETFAGAFGAYPFTRSGHIYVSDVSSGLFIFSFGGATGTLSNTIAP